MDNIRMILKHLSLSGMLGILHAKYLFLRIYFATPVMSYGKLLILHKISQPLVSFSGLCYQLLLSLA